MTQRHTCPVCGYPGLSQPPREPDGDGTYVICHSCGFEFGVTDDDQGYTDESWRERWVALGMPWDSDGIEPPPPGWNPQQQLADLLGGGPVGPSS